MNFTNNECDVLVVGAGPTGTIITNELLRRGIDTRWVEKRQSPLGTTRAFTVHARTFEMLEHIGIAHKILEVNAFCPGNRFHIDGLNVPQEDMPVPDFRTLQSIAFTSERQRRGLTFLSFLDYEFRQGHGIFRIHPSNRGTTISGSKHLTRTGYKKFAGLDKFSFHIPPRTESVTYISGINCYPCSRYGPPEPFGGERGIRTLDTLLTYTHFPGVRLKPLGHLS